MLAAHLQQIQFIWAAGIRLLVPAAIGITHTTEAIVITSIAHRQIDLLDAMICGNIERFTCLTETHHLYRFFWCHIEDVKQFRQRFTVTIVLYDFIDTSQIGAHIVDGILLVEYVNANSVEEREKEFIITLCYNIEILYLIPKSIYRDLISVWSYMKGSELWKKFSQILWKN